VQRIRSIVTLAALSAAAMSGIVAATPADAAAAALKCKASVSNSRPADYTTVKVRVATAAKAKVSTAAHYKTTTNTKHATAGPKGNAVISYSISRATPGYKVKVTVTVKKSGRHGSCSTSFTPKR
jgi:hypothetical protein